MRIYIRIILAFFFFFISLFQTKVVSASSILFQDDFNDGNYNGWEIVQNTCTFNGQAAEWKIVDKSPNNIDKKIGMLSNGGGCFSKLVPTNSTWNFSDKNYIIDFDIELVQGSDYAFIFRYADENTLNGIHIQVPNDVILQSLEDSNDPTGISFGDYSNGQTIHFKIYVNGKNVKVYKNLQLEPIIDHTSVNDPSPTGRIALHIASGSSVGEVYFDNINVESIDNPSSSLNVPLIKQNDSLWKNKLYDSANIWSSNDTGIGSWGCALTSAAMVFQYHNITKLPNNQTLNPETLNAWLKNEPDGYVNTGWVNWLALSRLSKKAKNKNPQFTHDALEYKRFGGGNKTQLTTDLTNNIPDILEVPGHFVVAKGIQGSTFLVNDPFYSRTLLTDYNETFTNLGRFTPSNTDLSYLMFYTDKDTSITVKDKNGNNIGESFIQNPYTNANNPNKQNGQPFTMYLLDKPDSQNYTIYLNSNKNHIYTFTTFLYDNNGEVITNNYSGTLGKGSDIFNLQFNKTNNKQNKIQQVTTYDSVINDIKELQAQNLIIPQIADGLVVIINKAKNPPGLPTKVYRLATLNSFKATITVLKGKGIDQKAYDILLSDINSLISSL